MENKTLMRVVWHFKIQVHQQIRREDEKCLLLSLHEIDLILW